MGQEGERLIVALEDGGELHVKAKNLGLGSTCAPVCLRARARAHLRKDALRAPKLRIVYCYLTDLTSLSYHCG